MTRDMAWERVRGTCSSLSVPSLLQTSSVLTHCNILILEKFSFPNHLFILKNELSEFSL